MKNAAPRGNGAALGRIEHQRLTPNHLEKQLSAAEQLSVLRLMQHLNMQPEIAVIAIFLVGNAA